MRIFARLLVFVLGLCVYGIAQNMEIGDFNENGETRMFPQSTPETSAETSNPQTSSNTPKQTLPNAILEENLQEQPTPIESETSQNSPNLNEHSSTNPFLAPQDSLEPQEILESQNVESPNLQVTEDSYPTSPVAKNVYLEMLNPPLDLLYVHQIIPLELKLLVLSDYSTIKTEFMFENNIQATSVEILNTNENWTLNAEDSSLRNTFYLKIKQPNYTIPEIRVIVNTSEGEANERTQSLSGKAIKLERKGNFSQVLAQDLKILDTKITNYDTNHNLAVLQLQSLMGNLFDFHLEAYTQQGIESKSGDYKQAVAFYYAIVPKDLNAIRFDYFNTTTSK